MDADPTKPISIELLRDRVLTDTVLKIDQQKNAALQQDLRSLFNKAAFVSNKANVLIDAIEKKASQYSIPVHPEADDVRAAVLRKSSDSPDGLRISFDLFRDAVDVLYRRKKVISEMILSEGLGDPYSILSKKIVRLRCRLTYPEETTGLTSKDIAFMLSQFFILYLANQLLGVFKGTDDAAFIGSLSSTSGKENALGVISFQVLLSFVVQLIIFGINEALLAEWLDESAVVDTGGLTGKQIIEAAKARKLEPIDKITQAYVGIDDYEKILNYAFDYLGRTTESGYEMWLGYVDAVDIRFSAQNLWTYAPVYSSPHAFEQAHKASLSRKRRKGSSSSDAENYFNLDVSDLIKTSMVGMNIDHFNEESTALDGFSKQLDTIAQTLGSTFSIEALCCLARFLVKIPKDKLQLLKAILLVALRSSADAYFLDLQALLSRMLNFAVFELLAREAIYQAEKFFDRIIERILGIFGDDIAILLCCPLIKDLVETLLRLIVDIENKLIDLIGQFARAITLNLNGVNKRYLFLNDNRYVHQILKLIDQITKMLDDIRICQETPTDDLIRQRINDHVQSMETIPSIEIESGAAEKYFSTADAKEGNFKRIIPALGQPISLEADMAETFKIRADELAQGGKEVLETVKGAAGVAQQAAERGFDNLLSELGIVKVDRPQGQKAEENEKLPGLQLCYRLFSELDLKNATRGL
jgi:hypothetical protein